MDKDEMAELIGAATIELAAWLDDRPWPGPIKIAACGCAAGVLLSNIPLGPVRDMSIQVFKDCLDNQMELHEREDRGDLH